MHGQTHGLAVVYPWPDTRTCSCTSMARHTDLQFYIHGQTHGLAVLHPWPDTRTCSSLSMARHAASHSRRLRSTTLFHPLPLRPPSPHVPVLLSPPAPLLPSRPLAPPPRPFAKRSEHVVYLFMDEVRSIAFVSSPIPVHVWVALSDRNVIQRREAMIFLFSD